jgi:site-specific DNA recombinase
MPDVSVPVLRAATYGRQSKAREDDSAGSPTAQRESTRSFVAARGWEFVGHYDDVGRSGYDPKAKRPGLEALLAAVRRREVDLVVVYRLDRLTRQGVVEAVRLVTELAKYEAALASVNEPFLDTTSAMGRGIFGLFAAMAEQESENISQRTRATKDILRRAGSFAGGQRPYGYRLAKEARDGLTLTVLRRDEEEAAVVADVVSRVLAGASVTSEAKRLNVEGIKSSTGKEWSVSTLSRLLQSPTLAGYKATTRDGLTLDEAGSPVRAWEPVVEPALWHQLKEALDGRRGGRGPRPGEPTLLGGFDLFRCASCGTRMAGDRRSDGRGTYRCALHRRGSTLCKGAAVAMRQADEYVTRGVWTRLRDLDLSDPGDRHFFAEVARRYATRTEADPEREATRRMAQAVLNDAEAALSQLDDDRSVGVFAGASGTERYRRQTAALNERAEAARATLAALPSTDPADDEAALRDVLHLLRYEGLDYRDPDSPWQAWNLQERRDFLSLFLDCVKVTKAEGRGGGDRVPWKGDERMTLEWTEPFPTPF